MILSNSDIIPIIFDSVSLYLPQLHDYHATLQFAPCTVFPIYGNEVLRLHQVGIMQIHEVL